jgi:tRNA-Thr(GGU) m(6)t(6)A37 methyltransferase TsaA
MTASKQSTASHPDEQTGDMVLQPVGVIKNQIKEPILEAGKDGIKMKGRLDDVTKKVHEIAQGQSEIIINPNVAAILEGIEEYSHIVVLYWAHKVPSESRSLVKVHPMGRKEIPKKGIFSTCSPARPNPVLMTVVRLCARRENVLTVAGLDAIDNTPVLDVKPYVPDFYPQDDVVIAGWMQRLLEEMSET